MKKGNPWALLPIGVFLAVYLGLGLTFEYGLQIARAGLEEAARNSKVISSGVNCYDGKLTNKNVAKAHEYEYTDLLELI